MPVVAVERQNGTHVVRKLLPIMSVVFLLYVLTGLALPVLPLYVHQSLGLSTFVVGLVSGSQFAASLVSRVWSGRHSDRYGAKGAVVAGLIAAAKHKIPRAV